MKYLIAVTILLVSCTSSHVYVNNGERGKVGKKTQLDVRANSQTTTKGVEVNEK